MSKIKNGQEFVCIKTVIMNKSKIEAYTKGYIYKSDINKCITNNQYEIDHSWISYDAETKEHFLKIKTKKENE